MAETVQEIIEDVESFSKIKDSAGFAWEYCDKHGLAGYQGQSKAYDMTRHLIERVRKAVAGDPTEWFVECNGEKVHNGDKATLVVGAKEYDVFALGPGRVVLDGGQRLFSRRCDLVIKVIPDTREKIIADLADEFEHFMGSNGSKELADEYYERFLKLQEVE